LQGAKSILEKGQTKILGTASVIWDQISEIWPQKGQHGNPGWSLKFGFLFHNCCDRKAWVASAQSFTLWQQATTEITCCDHSPRTLVFTFYRLHQWSQSGRCRHPGGSEKL